MKTKQPTTKAEARQYATDYQNWVSQKSLSYGELAEWSDIMAKLGRKFRLLKEFKENGII